MSREQFPFDVWCPSHGEDIFHAIRVVAYAPEDAAERFCELIWQDAHPFDALQVCVAEVQPGQEKWGATFSIMVEVRVVPCFEAHVLS